MGRLTVALKYVSIALLAGGFALGDASGRSAAAQPSPPSQRPGASPAKDADPSLVRLPSALRRLVEAERFGALAAVARRESARITDNRVLVTVQAKPGQAAPARAAAVGAGGTLASVFLDRFDAHLPPSALPGLSRHPSIGRIDLPVPAAPNAITGEGIGQIGASVWHGSGATGLGAKIGIIDFGFWKHAALLGLELPATVDTSCSPIDWENGNHHGVIVAEVVHEVAPGAELFFAAVATATDMGAAVDCFARKGVSVINHSGGWLYSGPGDGTGPVNDVVDAAVRQGMFWANSAGNAATDHWSGPWTDQDADGWLDFAGPAGETQRVTLQQGETYRAALRWNDPWDGSCNDYDLYLWDNANFAGTPVKVSDDQQACDPAHQPKEWLTYTPAVSGSYYLAVRRHQAGGQQRLDLITIHLPLQYAVATSSLLHPADSANPGMLAAAAYSWANPSTIEAFSSRGPTTDGRTKPDIAGPDRVTTASMATFFGTSSASAHLAGAAALVKQAVPGSTPAQIASLLRDRAVDAGPLGPDNEFGAGRLSLGTPPSAAPARFHGAVSLNGSPAQTGATVVARIDGVDCGSTVVTYGYYAVDVASVRSRVGCGIDGATVTFRVNGVDAHERGTYRAGSLVLLALTVSPAPASPTNLTATAAGPGAVRLVWQDNATNETGYELISSAGATVALGANATTYTWDNLTSGGMLCVRIRAVNAAGASPWTSYACAATPAAPSLGGHGFTLAVGGASSQLSWTGGTLQTGYVVARIALASGTIAYLPSAGSPLAAGATNYSDSGPLTESFYCYQVVPLGPAGPLGRSDLPCRLMNTRSGTGAPTSFGLRLDQSSTATLTWSGAGGQTGYALWVIPTNGGPAQVLPVPAGATSMTHDTGGAFTCYALLPLNGNTVIGNSEILCAIPGLATFGAGVVANALAAASATGAATLPVGGRAPVPALNALVTDGAGAVAPEQVAALIRWARERPTASWPPPPKRAPSALTPTPPPPPRSERNR